MSAAEEQAAAALRASKAINEGQQTLTDESRLLLADLLEERMRIAVAEGIASALTGEAAERFWIKALEVLQRQARDRAGTFLLSGLTSVLKKAAWIGIFVIAIYSIGGWTLVKTVWAALMKGST